MSSGQIERCLPCLRGVTLILLVHPKGSLSLCLSLCVCLCLALSYLTVWACWPYLSWLVILSRRHYGNFTDDHKSADRLRYQWVTHSTSKQSLMVSYKHLWVYLLCAILCSSISPYLYQCFLITHAVSQIQWVGTEWAICSPECFDPHNLLVKISVFPVCIDFVIKLLNCCGSKGTDKETERCEDSALKIETRGRICSE